jgi:hypothetical protein
MNINVSNIQIPYENYLIRIGYVKSAKAPDNAAQISISETLQLAQKLIRPKAAVVFCGININENLTVFEDGFKIESFQVAKLFEGCFKAYGVAVTIGPGIEKKRNELITKKETLQAFLIDAAGSVAAEEVIKSVNEQIKKFEEPLGNKITKRFSPGYGDWFIQSQKKFLEWIGARQIGINLNSSFQMQPEKSVSAVIGVKRQ